MEKLLENFTPWQVVLIVVILIIGIAEVINTIGSAVEKIAKARKALNAPNATQDAKIADLERRMEVAESYLDNDNRHFEKVDEAYRVTQLALLALLDHGIDGNNTEQMLKAKAELQTYLINR